MIELLLEAGVAEIVASEISSSQKKRLDEHFRGKPVEIRLVDRADASILAEPCTIVAPNALGGILGPETIPRVAARIICGAANNQLVDDRRDDRSLHERGMLYVPDFVANRMGIVNCANEQYGVLPNDPAIERHFDAKWEGSVYAVTRRVLDRARATETTPTAAANALADELARESHPLFGHRAREIVHALVHERWERH